MESVVESQRSCNTLWPSGYVLDWPPSGFFVANHPGRSDLEIVHGHLVAFGVEGELLSSSRLSLYFPKREQLNPEQNIQKIPSD